MAEIRPSVTEASRQPQVCHTIARGALLAALYFGAGKLGLHVASVHPSATAVWAPTGIALAAFLLLGDSIWPGILVGAFLVNVTTAGSVATSLGIAIGNTLEGLLGAYLLRRCAHGRHVFKRAPDIFKFVVLAGAVSPSVSATVGVTSLALGGFAPWANYGAIWLTWWLGDLVGALVVAPLLLLWSLAPRPHWTRAQTGEALLALFAVCLVGLTVFSGLGPSSLHHYPLEFVCIPLILWVAFRLGQREAATATSVLAGIAIWGAVQGFGPFIRPSPNETLLLVQAFTGVLAMMGVTVGAVVAERKQVEAALRRHAFYDSLTNLPNRALFMDRLQHLLERCTRHPEQHFAVLFLDLDRFKTINDSLGHLVGDQLLIETARRLRDCLRQSDTVARLGGDEFLILLEDVSEVRHATQVVERILHALALPFHLHGHTVVTTASIGIVFSTPDYARPDDLVRDADSAMYHAKAQGKGQYAVFAPAMHAQVLRFLHLEAALREAIARQELRLHYQPIIALPSRAIIGVEALARWQHPERGAIAPAEFIPLAEETGLIIPLGDWVLRTACAQAKAWQDAGWASCSMAVNVSAQQLQRPEAGSRILQIVHETGLEPQCLKLELTESSVWEHGAVIAALLQQLNTAGVQLSVDDFGTGYSSLSALKHLPITSLKIDQAFVHDIPTDANDAAIVMAMIAVAHSLDLQVVAEGVETEAQVAFLRAQQCDAIQGYLISRPACAETLTQRWQARHWGACDRVDAPTS